MCVCLCVCVFVRVCVRRSLKRVSSILVPASSAQEHLDGPLVLISLRATLNVNIWDSISFLLTLCRVHYHLSAMEGNLLMCNNSLCTLPSFHGRCFFFLSSPCPLLSLADLPPEGSSRRRDPADNTRQEPGPAGWSSEGLHWRRAMYPPAWVLLCLRGVSTIRIMIDNGPFTGFHPVFAPQQFGDWFWLALRFYCAAVFLKWQRSLSDTLE